MNILSSPYILYNHLYVFEIGIVQLFDILLRKKNDDVKKCKEKVEEEEKEKPHTIYIYNLKSPYYRTK